MPDEVMSIEEFRREVGQASPVQAKGRLTAGKKRGDMTAQEERFEQHLKVKQLAGLIDSYWYEPIRFRIAGSTNYTPDFMTIGRDGEVTFIEVKGKPDRESRVKLRTCAELFPCFAFEMWTEPGGNRFECEVIHSSFR